MKVNSKKHIYMYIYTQLIVTDNANKLPIIIKYGKMHIELATNRLIRLPRIKTKQ